MVRVGGLLAGFAWHAARSGSSRHFLLWFEAFLTEARYKSYLGPHGEATTQEGCVNSSMRMISRGSFRLKIQPPSLSPLVVAWCGGFTSSPLNAPYGPA